MPFQLLSCGFIHVQTPSLATIKTWQDASRQGKETTTSPLAVVWNLTSKIWLAGLVFRKQFHFFPEKMRSRRLVTHMPHKSKPCKSHFFFVCVLVCLGCLCFFATGLYLYYHWIVVISAPCPNPFKSYQGSLQAGWRCHIRDGHLNLPGCESHSGL